MSGVNKVILVGRLGAEPELRNTPSGMSVCVLSIATSETWLKDGKREEKTEWHRVVLWNKLAELANKYLKKGRMVYIEGKLQTRSWQDQQGQKRYSTEVVANTMQFIDNTGSTGSRDEPSHAMNDMQPPDSYYQTPSGFGSNNQSHDPFQTSSHSMDDDVPF